MTEQEFELCPTCRQAVPRANSSDAGFRERPQAPSTPPGPSRDDLSASGEIASGSTAPDPILLDLGGFEDQTSESRVSPRELGVEIDAKVDDGLLFLRSGQSGDSDSESSEPELSVHLRPRASRSASSSRSAGIDEERRVGLGFLLLSIYATAATVALFWFAVPARVGSLKDEPAAIREGGGIRDPGLRGGASKTVEKAEPIPDEHRTTIGRPLRLDSLEITPLGVVRKPITLSRTRITGGIERRDEPEPVLVLNLRFRNVSDDLIFAPFDESFVRDPENAICDSFVDFGDNTRVYPYSLATQSEWSIDGQTFRELKPGETLDTVFATSTEGARLDSKEILWRIRVRTGLRRTEVIGVTSHVP